MKCSSAEFLDDFVEPYGQQVQGGEQYLYVDHTDDIGLLAYLKETYVFSSVPLSDLLTQVSLSQARMLMKQHGISCGAKEGMSAIRTRLEHHSGLCCVKYKSIFIKKLTKAKTPTERWRIHSAKSKTHPEVSYPKLDGCGPSMEFPPAPLDKNLRKLITETPCN
jgi:hypothetical protein